MNRQTLWKTRPFLPAAWAAGPNAQTLVARVSRSAFGPAYTRERLFTPDGDFVDLDWGTDPSPEAPIVLVLHGLEGSSHRRYVRSVCRGLLEAGIRPAALNFRGCSGTPNRVARSYHSGETSDPAWVLEKLRERHPDRRFGALGVSLGGNVLLKLVGERDEGGVGLLDAAVAMSVPYDLAAGCDLLERTAWGRLYTRYFLRSLQRKVRLKRALLEETDLDLEAVLAATTIRQFDDRLTAPLNGFASSAEYYGESSSTRYLAGVRVPTLLLHAVDDPFLPAESIPVAAARANPRLHLELQTSGGHVGFLEGSPWRPRLWADEEAVRFLAGRLLNGRPRRASARPAGGRARPVGSQPPGPQPPGPSGPSTQVQTETRRHADGRPKPVEGAPKSTSRTARSGGEPAPAEVP